MKGWVQVSYDSEEPARGALIKIFRQRGQVVATVTQYHWLEPDGHEFSGYADVRTSRPRPAGEVLAEYRKTLATVALESVDLWDISWGRLL